MTRVVVTDVVFEVEGDGPPGRIGDAALLRELVDCLAEQGIVVLVLHDLDPPLPRPGDVSTRDWQRRLAGRPRPLGSTWGAGRPVGNLARTDQRRPMLWAGEVFAGVRPPGRLLEDGLLIGSDPECDLVLPGIEPVQAQVRHERGAWLVHAIAGVTRVDGVPVVAQVLGEGSTIQLGQHRLTYLEAGPSVG